MKQAAVTAECELSRSGTPANEPVRAVFEQGTPSGAAPAVCREVKGKVRVLYDPSRLSAIEAREYLGERTAFTEGAELDAVRRTCQENDGAFRKLMVAFLDRVDCTQDAFGTAQEFSRILALAELQGFAEKRVLRIVRADGPNAHLLTKALVVDGVLLVPPCQSPRDTLRDVVAAEAAVAVH
ncbi:MULTISPECIES: hypothetical protein [unclassified Streptomyces]|uniref:hypothetical protein n=1 Tax=unclassified Streptomyces TaxID=2593676 RepID=UPI002255A30B|nr:MULTISPECIES: hypothetical protein [unclassified Streptomyces]MCX5123567.1 hypothetical protein [Streptomyces sp. NBC_00347]MCX5405660.1 hypothetical protein [Streptomyces sp. NBC_00086]